MAARATLPLREGARATHMSTAAKPRAVWRWWSIWGGPWGWGLRVGRGGGMADRGPLRAPRLPCVCV